MGFLGKKLGPRLTNIGKFLYFASMVLLIIFFLVSILFSFLCSIWEAVILSITPSYINRKEQEGGSIGKLLKSYKEDIDRPLSAILTLNTIAHTVGAIGVGAQSGNVFGNEGINLLGININGESIIAVFMTLAILILSEIIPKTIGANFWERLAPFTVKSLRLLLLVLHPLVWISQLITKRLKKDKNKSVLSRADFAAMTQVGVESGAILQNESTIIQNLLRLQKLLVKDIMTPRSVMISEEESETIENFYKKHKPLQFSRIPIYKSKPDEITGLVLKDEILRELADDHHGKKLSDIRRPIHVVKDEDGLSKLLDVLVKTRAHMAIVVDSYGSIVGLVSMEDLFETILGLEIVDESDSVQNLQQLARKQWEARAKKLGLVQD